MLNSLDLHPDSVYLLLVFADVCHGFLLVLVALHLLRALLHVEFDDATDLDKFIVEVFLRLLVQTIHLVTNLVDLELKFFKLLNSIFLLEGAVVDKCL